MITAVTFLNNDISAQLAYRDLVARGIPLSKVAVILGRELNQPWFASCAEVCRYGAPASLSFWGQAKFFGFYRRAARLIKRVHRAGGLRDVYVVNNDNLLTAHLLNLADREPAISATVAAEGLMNYQDITVHNRAAWRWRVKPFISALLGLRYHIPTGHLSGAFEQAVDRVISFSAAGLKAPLEKVIVYPLDTITNYTPTNSRIALLVHTALWQWMPEADYRRFAEAFTAWLRSQGFTKLYAKPHPRYETGIIETLLPEHTVIIDPRPVEELASELDAGTVLGTCCTALATLKMLRPDLDCVDYGADFYLPHAYRGDQSVLELFNAVGVRPVKFDS